MTARPFNWRHLPGGRSLMASLLVFLYAPLVILVIYAFNSSRIVTVWGGFSTRWFILVWNNPDIRSTAYTSVTVAVLATIFATAFAVAAALALERGRLPGLRSISEGLIALPLVVPEIVVAITTLVFFSAIGLKLGAGNLVIAHTVFCIPFALLPMRARLRDMGQSAEHAARDLYASDWQVFRRITLPLMAPAIASGAMLSFVTSLDDFIISMMVADAGVTTLPVYVYGMMRVGVTPEVNAVSAILLGVSLLLVVFALLLIGRKPDAA